MAERIGVIGSGVSGLTAAYLLSKHNDVTLLEADSRFGGHAHTHRVQSDAGELGVDSGFIVHNRRTYPNLLKLFEELGVDTIQTEMSMSITCQGCGLQYAGGRGLKGVLAQPLRLLDPRFVRMLIEVPRFHRQARALLATDSKQTWGEFLTSGGFSRYFIRHFAIPLVSCVWSADDEDSAAYPARHLFAFLEHHGMLTVKGSPTWFTVAGGSHSYVDRVIAQLSDARLNAAVKSVNRHSDHVQVELADGRIEHFDRVVLATHADTALQLLADADLQEQVDLGAIGYTQNQTWLHTDSSALPKASGARASWNYTMAECDTPSSAVVVSYWMNLLQRLPGTTDFVVTLNGVDSVEPDKVIARMQYAHPVFTNAAVEAASRLSAAGGPRLAFAGAHLGWGFHEDGCRSGVAAAAKFGATW